jgi:hypothetical protein
MAQSLPMKTTEADLDKVVGYLKSQVGWVALDKIRKAIPSKYVNGMKIEAMRHIGLIERDGENIKLTTDGREYASGDAARRAEIMRQRLRADGLYNATLEWMHFNDKAVATKNDVANYWHDHHTDEIGGAKGDALTDPAVFFMRMIGLAGLAKFTAAGAGRETHITVDPAALEDFATGQAPHADDPTLGDAPPLPPPPGDGSRTRVLDTAPALNVNVEIHIAADAKASTVEEIFRNMRKYLIDGPDTAADG